MPEIHNLTKEDVAILDTIWALDTQEDLDNYLSSVSGTKRQRVENLIEMIRLALIDDEVEAMDSYPDAEQILKNILH